ncbi:Sas10/U3 ribonucleoprotein (Utp) family protein, partial [Thalictrum thalictroides]
MGKKKGGRGAERWQNKATKSPKIRTRDFNEEDMDDEIDTFHKQRDIVPLDVNEDIDSSNEDDVQPVFDLEGLDEDEEDDDDDDYDDKYAAKIKKQQKFLIRKTGGVEDETHDDSEEDEVKVTCPPGYGADNVDYELESGDEDLAEEEAEVIRTRKRNAEMQSIEDFVAEDIDLDESASDGEKTIEHILHNKTRVRSRPQDNKGAEDDTGAIYEVKKDLKALSREEQMDVVYSSAPELVGLLSELKNALHQLESKVNPLISK